jgi:glycosyltransferase involved in cell wall biosynthesis
LVLPAKTLNYLAAGRPLIAAMTGTVAEIVRDSGAGLVVPPDDPAQLARAVEHLASLSVADREKMGQRGRAYVQEHFGRAKIMNELETLLVEVAQRQ